MRAATLLTAALSAVSGVRSAAIETYGRNRLPVIRDTSSTLDSSWGSGPRSDTDTCRYIARYVSADTGVHYPGSPEYTEESERWLPSSGQPSACTVSLGNTNDVSTALQILGRTSTTFGVKGGGHASDVNISSTFGVQISMEKFTEIRYSSRAKTVRIGTGQRWDVVYNAIAQYNVSVAGGRLLGVGVAGFVTGGGYSFFTNKLGLTVDTMTEFDIVLPNGTYVQRVTSSSNPDLWFGVRGGFNNFGIVTSFTLTAQPQTLIYAGLLVYDIGNNSDAAIAALASFSDNNKDVSANAVGFFGRRSADGVQRFQVTLFYNAPTAPTAYTSPFTSIPTYANTLKTQTLMSYITAVSPDPTNAANLSGLYNSISTQKLTADWMKYVVQQMAIATNTPEALANGVVTSFAFEPLVTNSMVRPLSDSAIPHDTNVLPNNVILFWNSSSFNARGRQISIALGDDFRNKAKAEGQDIDSLPLYSNYGLRTYPIERYWGKNVATLKKLRAKYDPNGVMLKCSGWKFI